MTGEGRDAVTKTDDGRSLMLESSGFLPHHFGDTRLYHEPIYIETILWLFNAAGAGIIGTLSADALKETVQKARELHGKFPIKQKGEKSGEPEKRSSSPSSAGWPPSDELVVPNRDLRDELVDIAYDTLARFYRLKGRDSLKRMSEITVYLTEVRTWAVKTREIRAADSVITEIDLRKHMEKNRERPAREISGFPVRIWIISH